MNEDLHRTRQTPEGCSQAGLISSGLRLRNHTNIELIFCKRDFTNRFAWYGHRETSFSKYIHMYMKGVEEILRCTNDKTLVKIVN